MGYKKIIKLDLIWKKKNKKGLKIKFKNKNLNWKIMKLNMHKSPVTLRNKISRNKVGWTEV